MAQTKLDIEKNGGKCVVISEGWWECTDLNGKKWWCDTESCVPPWFKEFPLGGQIVRVKLDVLVAPEKSGGFQVFVRPHPHDGPIEERD